MDKMGGGISIFSVENFLSYSAENFGTLPKSLVREPFCGVFQKISGSEKVYG